MSLRKSTEEKEYLFRIDGSVYKSFGTGINKKNQKHFGNKKNQKHFGNKKNLKKIKKIKKTKKTKKKLCCF